jgi:hypothetical protein
VVVQLYGVGGFGIFQSSLADVGFCFIQFGYFGDGSNHLWFEGFAFFPNQSLNFADYFGQLLITRKFQQFGFYFSYFFCNFFQRCAVISFTRLLF